MDYILHSKVILISTFIFFTTDLLDGIQMNKENNNSPEALRRIKTLFEAIWDNSAIGIYETDAEGQCISVNKEWCKFAGISKEDALGDGWQQALHPDDREGVFALWNQHAKTNQPWSFEYRLQTPESVITWVWGTSNPIINKQGEITGYIGVNTDITKHKQAEEKQKESFQFNQQIITGAQHGIIVYDCNMNYQLVNPYMEEMSGISAAEVLGKHPSDVTPFLKDADIIDKALNGITDSTKEYPFHVPSTGKKGWASATTAPMYNLEGEIIGAISTIENITQRKNVEKNLLQKNEAIAFSTSFSHKLADSHSKDIIKDIALPYIKKHTNAVYAQFTAYDTDKKALVIKHIEADNAFLNTIIKNFGKKIFSAFYPVSEKDHQLIMSSKIKVMQSLTEATFGAIPKKTSEAIRKITGLSNFFGVAQIDSGKLYGITLLAFKKHQSLPSVDLLKSYSNILSVSLRKNIIEQTLIQSEHLLSEAQKISKMGAWSYDVQTQKMTFTETVFTIYGKRFNEPEEGIHGYHPEDKELVWNSFSEAISKQKPYDLEVRFINAQKKRLYVRTIGKPVIENGKVIEVNGILMDITKRKTAEQKLKASEHRLKVANTTKDKLFSIIAHDLKSPLNSILGFSELLIKKTQTSDIEKTKKFATIINTSAKNNIHLLDNLLTWGKTQMEQIEFKPKNLVLQAIGEETLLVLNSSASLKNIKLISSLSDNIVAYADQEMLSLILRNLIQNAIKFTHSGGEVGISAVSKQDHIEISVTDNGIGITKENKKKLFGADVNFTMNGTENESGSGLGLMLCKEFVEKHGGKIWVESAVRKGSKFVFTLPVFSK
jgi:PAS domain S-box-containing protein